jgi:hypothetical protein
MTGGGAGSSQIVSDNNLKDVDGLIARSASSFDEGRRICFVPE